MNHDAKHTFRVAMLGLPEIEQRVLRSIARVSAGRPHSYEFVEIDSQPREQTDIVLIDGDSPQAMQVWRADTHGKPGLFIVREELEGQSCLRRPILGGRLLTMLDNIAAKLTRPARDQHPDEGLALVVDDSPTVRRHVAEGLQPFGLTVHLAESGEQALERLAAHSYDIVFLDVVMPGIDGYAVCKSIKKHRSMKTTPVIMLTGKSSPFDRIKGSLAGCDTYLTKPVNYQVFQEVVRKCLDSRTGIQMTPAPDSPHPTTT